MKKEELSAIGISESDDFENAAIIYKELYICYFVRKKEKKETEESFDFERSAGEYISKLVDRIMNYSFRIEKFRHFKIHNPDRIINAPDETDRLGEYWLCQKYIIPYLMGLIRQKTELVQTDLNLFPRLYVNNMACQEGKGTSETMRRLSFALSQAHVMYGNEFYVFQYDIKKFYDNISHEAAKELFKDLPLCAYKTVCNVIDSYHCNADNTDCYAVRDNPYGVYGFPKGTLVSQWVGVMILDKLDRYLTSGGKSFFGIRYMDDGVFFFRSKYEARSAMEYTMRYLEKAGLGIRINMKKSCYYKASRGINFCGWFYKIMPDHSVIKRIASHKKKEQYGKFKTIQHLYKYDYITFDQAIVKMRGIFAHLDKGDTFRLRRYYQERFYLTHGNKNQRLIEEEHNEKEKDS